MDFECPGEAAASLPYWLMYSARGWSPLIRAFFTLVLPMQRDGQARPARVVKTSKSYGVHEPWLGWRSR